MKEKGTQENIWDSVQVEKQRKEMRGKKEGEAKVKWTKKEKKAKTVILRKDESLDGIKV